MLVFAVIVYALVKISGVEGHEVSLRCIPEESGKFSSHETTVVIYKIGNDTVTTQDEVSIICSIDDRTDIFVKLEFIHFFGEPPKSLTLEVDTHALSVLKKSLISCHAGDIKNRIEVEKEWETSHQNITGDVTYKCSNETRINIDGLIMLNEDFSLLTRVKRDVGRFKEILVSVGNNSGNHQNLGKNCGENGTRWMYDESGNFVCGKCSAGSYWHRRSKSCAKCGLCNWNDHPNLRTDCMALHRCRSSTTSAVPSTTLSTTTGATSTTSQSTTSTPVPTTIMPPLPTTATKKQRRFPKNLTLEAGHGTIVLLRWKKTSGTYMVRLRDKRNGFFTDYSLKETHVEITGLIQEDFDKAASIHVNSTGSSSWISIGTAPKQPPENVKAVLNGSAVTVSWNDYADTFADGLQIEVFLENKTDSVYIIRHNKVNSRDIYILAEGNYTFQFCYYNMFGSGPVVTKFVDFRTPMDFHTEGNLLWLLFIVIGLLLGFIIGIFIQYYFRDSFAGLLSSCRDRAYQLVQRR